MPSKKGKKIPHTVVGLIMDLIDYFILGLIPGVGDVLDLLATAYFLKALGAEGIASAIELIPASDFLPINIALGAYADYKKKPRML